MEAELGAPLTVVATGGLAPNILPCCQRDVQYDADLLFKGLAVLYARNAGKAGEISFDIFLETDLSRGITLKLYIFLFRVCKPMIFTVPLKLNNNYL